MSKKVTAFQYLNGIEESRISYTYHELNDLGEVVKSNIRKSVTIPASNIVLFEALNTINNFLIDETMVSTETVVLQDKVSGLESDSVIALEAIAEMYEQLLALQDKVNGGIV